MSKVDALRAMREARFEALTAQAAGTSTRRAARASKTPASASSNASDAAPPSPAPEPATVAESADAVETDLCGHRNMGNKGCRRPKGHSEKNHRYT